MLGIPPSPYAPIAPQRRRGTPERKHKAWVFVLMALGLVAVAAFFGAPGAIIELSIPVLGLSLLGASLVRPGGGSLRAGILVFLLVAVVTTGALKAAWLVNNLPSMNDHGSPLPYPFVAALAPMTVLIATFSLRGSSLSLTKKVIRVATIGLLVGFLPWLLLMMTGIAD